MLVLQVHSTKCGYLQSLYELFFMSLKTAVLVLPFFLLSPAFAKTVFASDYQNTPWKSVIQELPIDKGTFNLALRNGVREELQLPKLSLDWAKNGLESSSAELINRLETLDAKLSRYVRVSERTSRFEQLKHLMPALANIEERKLIEALLTKQGVKVPRLRNARVLPFLDKRIADLANSMIFNMKALVRQRRDYEPQLMDAMARHGVEFSARVPDFVLDYMLVPDGQDEQGNWLFEGYIALLGKYEIQIVSFEDSIVKSAADEASAQELSMDELAQSITEKLKTFLLSKS